MEKWIRNGFYSSGGIVLFFLIEIFLITSFNFSITNYINEVLDINLWGLVSLITIGILIYFIIALIGLIVPKINKCLLKYPN